MKHINRVLITGVAGFIGSNLLDHIMEHTPWKVTGVDDLSTGSLDNIAHHLNDPRVIFAEQSLFDLGSLRAYDVVFHLAALPRIQPSYKLINEHIKANLMGAMHLVELMVAEEYFPRLVNSSSSAVYGTPDKTPTSEMDAVDCLSPYAFQKYETEKYLEILAERYPLDYVNLRYFNPYGPRSYNPENKFSAYSSVVGIFLYNHKMGKKLQITGDGLQKRDFVHVHDVAQANVLAAQHEGKLNTAINVGHSSTLSILDLAKKISDDYEFIDKREGEAEITYADITKAREVLGWEPRRTLDEFIKSELS